MDVGSRGGGGNPSFCFSSLKLIDHSCVHLGCFVECQDIQICVEFLLLTVYATNTVLQ